jgi:hypothetical protein
MVGLLTRAPDSSFVARFGWMLAVTIEGNTHERPFLISHQKTTGGVSAQSHNDSNGRASGTFCSSQSSAESDSSVRRIDTPGALI